MSALTELAAPAAPRPPLPTQQPKQPRRLAVVPTQRLTLVPAIPGAESLAKIREYETLVHIPANFSSPFANPGLVAAWVLDYNAAAGTNSRPDAA